MKLSRSLRVNVALPLLALGASGRYFIDKNFILLTLSVENLRSLLSSVTDGVISIHKAMCSGYIPVHAPR
jgi:hypothetical protein